VYRPTRPTGPNDDDRPVSEPTPADAATAPAEPTMRDLLRYFLGLGTWGFGGPIATVGYMQRDLVERRSWLSERDFLDGVALGQTMPGPLAAQVVMWVGYLRARALGALATSVAFVLPSLAAVLLVAYLYVRYEGLSWVQSLFYGIAPAVMAIIALAAVKLARLTNGRDPRLWIISAVTLSVTALTGAEIALLFVAAGLVMMVWEAPPRRRPRAGPPASLLGVGAAPGVLLGAATGGTLVALGLFFLKAGAFIFGSGLAIVPFLRAGVVEQHHWLTAGQFLDAVAIGLITPGPVVISAAFIGYLVGGLAGAGVSTVAIFLPIYLGVVVPGRWFVRHRAHPRLRGFVKGATAAAAGAIGGATIVLTKQAVVDWPAAAIALVALVVLWRFRVKEPLVVLAAGVAGLLLR
jgi:chromate transporter